MADEAQTNGAAPVPPKLNLSKRLGIKPAGPDAASAPTETPSPIAAPAPISAPTPIPAPEPIAAPAPVVAPGTAPAPAIRITPPATMPAVPKPVAAPVAGQGPSPVLKPTPTVSGPAPTAPRLTAQPGATEAPKPVIRLSIPSDAAAPAAEAPKAPMATAGPATQVKPLVATRPPPAVTPANKPIASPPPTISPVEDARVVTAEAAADAPRTVKIQRPAGAPTVAGPKPADPTTAATIKLQRPDAAASPTGPDIRTASKRETSKIPLEVATAMHTATAGSTAPKTIRIKTPGSGPGPVGAPAPLKPGAAPESPTAEKRKTSRIALETALTGEPKADEETPKTIKLKRPSEASTVKVAAPPAEAGAPAADAKSKTARLDDLPPVEEEASPTRKKTIKVKRFGASPAAGVAAELAGEEGAEPAARAPASFQAAPVAAAGDEDEPHWSFALVSVASLILSLVIIWMLCAQAMGPDICLTQLSYGAKTTDLPWPGKISGSR